MIQKASNGKDERICQAYGKDRKICRTDGKSIKDYDGCKTYEVSIQEALKLPDRKVGINYLYSMIIGNERIRHGKRSRLKTNLRYRS